MTTHYLTLYVNILDFILANGVEKNVGVGAAA